MKLRLHLPRGITGLRLRLLAQVDNKFSQSRRAFHSQYDCCCVTLRAIRNRIAPSIRPVSVCNRACGLAGKTPADILVTVSARFITDVSRASTVQRLPPPWTLHVVEQELNADAPASVNAASPASQLNCRAVFRRTYIRNLAGGACIFLTLRIRQKYSFDCIKEVGTLETRSIIRITPHASLKESENCDASPEARLVAIGIHITKFVELSMTYDVPTCVEKLNVNCPPWTPGELTLTGGGPEAALIFRNVNCQ